jgi:hypothetical protein
MNRIVIDDPLTQQFRSVADLCEIVDSSGNRLGLFQPEAGLAIHEGYECPLSDEELDRIEQEGPGRPLAHIFRDLESRK